MKKLILLLAGLFIVSCSETPVAETKEVNKNILPQVEFKLERNPYHILYFKEGTPEAELKEYSLKQSNPNETSWFLFYPKDADISLFKQRIYSQSEIASIVTNNKPKYGFYKMPMDTIVMSDAVELMELAMP